MTTDVEDFLAHHGVKGMRWGHRTAGAQATISPRKAARVAKKEARDAEDAAIVKARGRQDNRSIKLQQKALATYVQNTKKGQKAAEEAYAKAEHHLINNPDAATAAKMTHGEKVADRISMSVALGVIGLAIGGAALGAVADSRR